MIPGKDGLWLREQVLILAKNNHTPVPYWLSVPLRELKLWIKSNNAIIADEKRAADGESKNI